MVAWKYTLQHGTRLSKAHSVIVVTLIRDERRLFDTLQILFPKQLRLQKNSNTTVSFLRLSRLGRIVPNATRLERAAQIYSKGNNLIRSLCMTYSSPTVAPIRRSNSWLRCNTQHGPWELSHAVNVVRSAVVR
jgi:hypothetical protein